MPLVCHLAVGLHDLGLVVRALHAQYLVVVALLALLDQLVDAIDALVRSLTVLDLVGSLAVVERLVQLLVGHVRLSAVVERVGVVVVVRREQLRARVDRLGHVFGLRVTRAHVGQALVAEERRLAIVLHELVGLCGALVVALLVVRLARRLDELGELAQALVERRALLVVRVESQAFSYVAIHKRQMTSIDVHQGLLLAHNVMWPYLRAMSASPSE